MDMKVSTPVVGLALEDWRLVIGGVECFVVDAFKSRRFALTSEHLSVVVGGATFGYVPELMAGRREHDLFVDLGEVYPYIPSLLVDFISALFVESRKLGLAVVNDAKDELVVTVRKELFELFQQGTTNPRIAFVHGDRNVVNYENFVSETVGYLRTGKQIYGDTTGGGIEGTSELFIDRCGENDRGDIEFFVNGQAFDAFFSGISNQLFKEHVDAFTVVIRRTKPDLVIHPGNAISKPAAGHMATAIHATGGF